MRTTINTTRRRAAKSRPILHLIVVWYWDAAATLNPNPLSWYSDNLVKMYTEYLWIFVVSVFLAVFVAWGIGANDVVSTLLQCAGVGLQLTLPAC